MKITITIDEAAIKKLIADHVMLQLGQAVVADVKLLVKSKQNYRATWEAAAVLVTNDEGRSEFQDAALSLSGTEIKAEVESKEPA